MRKKAKEEQNKNAKIWKAIKRKSKDPPASLLP